MGSFRSAGNRRINCWPSSIVFDNDYMPAIAKIRLACSLAVRSRFERRGRRMTSDDMPLIAPTGRRNGEVWLRYHHLAVPRSRIGKQPLLASHPIRNEIKTAINHRFQGVRYRGTVAEVRNIQFIIHITWLALGWRSGSSATRNWKTTRAK